MPLYGQTYISILPNANDPVFDTLRLSMSIRMWRHEVHAYSIVVMLTES